MEPSETALDVDAYQSWRRSCFYPKADLPLPDSILRGEASVALDVNAIAQACSDLLGETVIAEPHAERGTFHRLWLVERKGGERLICRINAMSRWFRDYPLWIESYVGQRLANESLPIVRSRAVDLTRQRCSCDFALMDEAKGVPLTHFDDREMQMQPLLRDLGRVLARMHRIEIDGYGLLDARALMQNGGQLLGSHEHWAEYLLTKLDEHVRICVAIGAINNEEAQRIHWLFEDCQTICAGVKSSLLHGDPGSHNVFATEGKISALIDWEDAVAGDPVYEIAFWATFHPERRHRAFLEGYLEVAELPSDFEPRFWMYYLRIALAKTVLRRRLGLQDRPGREPAAQRIQLGLKRLDAACAMI